MGLFSSYNAIEKGLLDIYSRNFSMMGIPNSKKTARDMLDKSIEDSKNSRTYILPLNFGNIILREDIAEDPKIEKVAAIFRRVLPQKRAEGVRDEDIRWWWNLNDVERYMMLSTDNMHKLALFIEVSTSSKEANKEQATNEAGKAIWEAHPFYTSRDPDIEPENSPFKLRREDYPLPVELKDRVNRYIENRAIDDTKKIRQELKGFLTFNAFIRKEIGVGNV